jgi:hypothetical protein
MRLLIRTFLALVLAATLGLAYAQAPESRSGAPDGQALIDRAKAMENAANQQLERDKAECYQQVLVNKCLSPANARHREARAEAHKLEVEGANLMRNAKMQEKTEKQQKALADESRREAEQRTRIEREQKKRERREAAQVTDTEEEKARTETFQKKHEEREAKRQAKAGNDAADLARRQAQAKGKTDVDREREYAERAAKVAERKKNYAEKLEREAAEKARKQDALDAANEADQERGAFWSPRRWIKD